jgi:hypothetical protein
VAIVDSKSAQPPAFIQQHRQPWKQPTLMVIKDLDVNHNGDVMGERVSGM